MKKYSFLFLTMMAVFWGCSDDDNSKDPGGETPEGPSVEISPVNGDEGSAVYATSAIFNLKANGVESYAYQVAEGKKTDSPAGEVIYAGAMEEGASGVNALEDGDNNVTIYGLEGNKTYTVFFAFKAGKEYILKSQTITTPAYTRMITVVDTKTSSIKVHFEVPKDTYYKVVLGQRDMYQGQKDQFHMTDGDYVKYGRLCQGPQTINFVDGEYLEENPDEYDTPMQVLTGCPYVIMLAECDEKGELMVEYDFGDGGDDIGGGDLLKSTRSVTAPLVEEDTYTEECKDEGVTFNGRYAKQYVCAGSTLIESKITIEQIKITLRSATFAITPDESVVKYAVNAMSEEEYNYYVTLCGERGMPTYMLMNTELYSDSQEMSTNPDYLPLEAGKNYKLVVVGTYNEDYSIQSYQVMDFSPRESTMPDAKLEITAKEDPDGSPWMVWFNVKAPNKDCAYIKYLMNYEKEWIPKLNSGNTTEDLMRSYGQYVNDAETISAINSNEGYDIGFSSWENIESRIVVGSFNEDENMSVYEGRSTSLPEPDQAKVDSPLFESLKGDWTATCHLQWSDYNGSYDKDVSFKVTLDGGPAQGPASVEAMDQDQYQDLISYFTASAIKGGQSLENAAKYAKEKVAELFKEYKELAAHYGDKYRGQNRLVGLGFDAAHEYMSSWDLFNDLSYSAYDTEELFYDYGPKLFLEISKDKVELVSDLSRIAPISAWQQYELCFIGFNSKSYNDAPAEHNFPVTVSEDQQTITIGGLDVDGTMCYPSPGYYMMGTYFSFVSKVTSPITLTKGWTEPADKTASIAKAKRLTVGNDKQVTAHRNGHRFMRTRLPWTNDGVLPLMKKATIKYVSLKDIQKKAAEQHARMAKKH